MKIIVFFSDDEAILREKVRLLLEAADALLGHSSANGVSGGPLLLREEKRPSEDAAKWN